MTVSSKFGQKYRCNIPVFEPPKTENIEENNKIDPKSIITTIDKSLSDTCLDFVSNWFPFIQEEILTEIILFINNVPYCRPKILLWNENKEPGALLWFKI